MRLFQAANYEKETIRNIVWKLNELCGENRKDVENLKVDFEYHYRRGLAEKLDFQQDSNTKKSTAMPSDGMLGYYAETIDRQGRELEALKSLVMSGFEKINITQEGNSDSIAELSAEVQRQRELTEGIKPFLLSCFGELSSTVSGLDISSVRTALDRQEDDVATLKAVVLNGFGDLAKKEPDLNAVAKQILDEFQNQQKTLDTLRTLLLRGFQDLSERVQKL